MTRSRIALFPGSFDPITVGHESVIRRALPMFDKIIVGVGVNSEKSAMLPSEKRVELIKKVFVDEPKVEVVTYSGLTVDFCKANNISFILRGLRTSADFEFERSIGHANQLLDKNIETVFMLTLPEHTFISSSIVRDIAKHNGDISAFLPKAIGRKDF
ncbi:MAG: pantetheine-phosphate adenylyltransferase [Bacteroidales bacterium]|nr:pantetheine-phosphate adenylyltransferase [Bacteroidales bacterium]